MLIVTGFLFLSFMDNICRKIATTWDKCASSTGSEPPPLECWTTAVLLNGEHGSSPTAVQAFYSVQPHTAQSPVNLCPCISYAHHQTSSHSIFIRSLLLADTKTRTKTTSHQANRMEQGHLVWLRLNSAWSSWSSLIIRNRPSSAILKTKGHLL